VQPKPSVQAVPSALTGFVQMPLAGLHVPASWQPSSAVQVTVDAGEPQAPVWQVSPVVHALPSSQLVPLALGTGVQVRVTWSHTPCS